MGKTLEPPYIIVKLRGDDDERVYRNATVTESDGRIYVTRGDRTIATFDEGALEYWDNAHSTHFSGWEVPAHTDSRLT